MKIGIMGAGGIARVMANTVNQMDDVTLYAIGSRTLDKAKKFAQEMKCEVAYGSYDELVKDDNIDLIYIATPHSEHFANMKLAIDNNKAILCEKSFTVNAKQAKEILVYAKKKNVFVAEAIWTRYMPSRFMIDEIIKSGKIGKVVSISANLGYLIQSYERIKKPELAGGALLDVGVYTVNFANMFAGNNILEVNATCIKNEYGVDSQNSITLKYSNNIMATLHSNTLAVTDQMGLIYGTKGYIIAKNINNITSIEIYSPERELLNTLTVPAQINGYEHQVLACKNAIEKGLLECDEMPHSDIINIMETMDRVREKLNIVYPFE